MKCPLRTKPSKYQNTSSYGSNSAPHHMTVARAGKVSVECAQVKHPKLYEDTKSRKIVRAGQNRPPQALLC